MDSNIFKPFYGEYWDKVKHLIDEKGWVYRGEAPFGLMQEFVLETKEPADVENDYPGTYKGLRWRPLKLSQEHKKLLISGIIASLQAPRVINNYETSIGFNTGDISIQDYLIKNINKYIAPLNRALAFDAVQALRFDGYIVPEIKYIYILEEESSPRSVLSGAFSFSRTRNSGIWVEIWNIFFKLESNGDI
jgi:hypothetical protein